MRQIYRCDVMRQATKSRRSETVADFFCCPDRIILRTACREIERFQQFSLIAVPSTKCV
ncbi:hypothetical protein ACMAUO_15305 [Gluconacetobacter sp. Hr-1-5]|uniref:hypothetical protein n=1 Tax=Gluconacetobacter sp. Hr-1-5 TaxID=3395370 RepID=UPI003B524B31